MHPISHILVILSTLCRQAIAAPIDGAVPAMTFTTAVQGVFSIILGTFLSFFGTKLFKYALFFAGYLVFSMITYFILITFRVNNNLVLILVPFVVGTIGGLIAWKLWKFGVSVIGFLGGAFLAVLILGLKTGGVIESVIGKLIFVVVFGIVGAIVIQLFERPALIVSTSFAGSYLVFFGIDLFVRTGFSNSYNSIVLQITNGQSATYELSGSVIGMLVGVVLMTLIGCLAQYRMNQGKDHRDDL